MTDLIIIGGGPAGYSGAERAAAAGLSVVLIEKRHLGGVCLNEGCVPSKTILNSANLYSQAREAHKFGVTFSDVKFDLTAVMARKNKVIDMLRKGIAATLKKFKVEVVSGEAKIVGKENNLFVVEANNTRYEGKRLLVCTGSEAIRIPIAGATQPFVMTNREILSIESIPQKLVVIGGGVIGLELAAFFAEVGSAVTVVEMLPSVGGPLESEIALLLQKELEKKGIVFKLNAKVSAIGKNTVTFACGDANETIPADVVLMSTGRRPVTQGFGLETLNVSVERNAVVVDEHGRTSVPGVWAAGDSNGVSMLAHTAYREVDVCVDDMLGKPARMRYNAIPAVIYTHPEVATVGLTEADAIKQNRSVVCAKLPLSYNGRYLAETEGGRGICKVVLDKETKAVIGVHMIGSHCSEMIFGAAIMIENELRVNDIKDIVFPHPTVSEIIKDTILSVH